MNGSEFLKQIMEKLYMSVDELSKRTDISKESLSDFLNRGIDLQTKDFLSLSKVFKISMEALVTGELIDDGDKIAFNNLMPTRDKYVDLYLEKCREAVEMLDLLKFLDLLIPVPNYDSRGRLQSFEGGVFSVSNNISVSWMTKFLPSVDIDKVIALDNYEIFEKFKDYPRTMGEMVYYLNEKGLVDKSKELQKQISGSHDSNRIRPVPPIEFKAIKKCTDIRFFENITLNDSDFVSALDYIDASNPSYWEICSILLKKGAYFMLGEPLRNNQGVLIRKMDVPKTMMFKYIVKQNIHN